MFSIVQMINSLPYSIHENLNCEFSLVEKYKDERFESYSGKIIDTNKLNWYPLDNIEEIIKIYIGVR